jgi:hypothetical protein
MPLPKPLSKEMILNAMRNTRSNRAAARYLNCSYIHYKTYAKLYVDEETGKTLFEKHLNPSGKGIPKFISGYGMDKFPILDIIEGRVNSDHFSPNKIKDSMIREGLIREHCACCGFQERRVVDFKMPLLMHFKDNNKRNYKPENLQLFCYNCYFLTIGDVFTPKQELFIQDHKSLVYEGNVDWELSDYHKQMLDEIVTLNNQVPNNEPDDDDPYSLVSRI